MPTDQLLVWLICPSRALPGKSPAQSDTSVLCLAKPYIPCTLFLSSHCACKVETTTYPPAVVSVTMFSKKEHSQRPPDIAAESNATVNQGTKRQTSVLRRSPTLSSPTSPHKMTFQQHPNEVGSNSGVPPRPYLARVPSVQTRYMEMLLHLDQIPRLHNILASLFTWILLAGFLIVPGTFTTFKKSDAYQNANESEENEIAHAIISSIDNIGLLWVSGAFCLIGALGCLFLWYKWRRNYVWLLNRIFL